MPKINVKILTKVVFVLPPLSFLSDTRSRINTEASNTARNVGSPALSGSPRPPVSAAEPQVTTYTLAPSPQSTLTGNNSVVNNNVPQPNVGGVYQAKQSAGGAIQGQNVGAATSYPTMQQQIPQQQQLQQLKAYRPQQQYQVPLSQAHNVVPQSNFVPSQQLPMPRQNTNQYLQGTVPSLQPQANQHSPQQHPGLQQQPQGHVGGAVQQPVTTAADWNIIEQFLDEHQQRRDAMRGGVPGQEAAGAHQPSFQHLEESPTKAVNSILETLRAVSSSQAQSQVTNRPPQGQQQQQQQPLFSHQQLPQLTQTPLNRTQQQQPNTQQQVAPPSVPPLQQQQQPLQQPPQQQTPPNPQQQSENAIHATSSLTAEDIARLSPVSFRQMLDSIISPDKENPPLLDSSFDSVVSASTASTSAVSCAQSTESSATEVQSNTSQSSSSTELASTPVVAAAPVSTSNTATATAQQQSQQQQEQSHQTQSNSTTASSTPVVNEAADRTTPSTVSCNDSDSQATSRSCPFHRFIPSLSDDAVQIKTEPGVLIKSEPIDTGYETSVIGTTYGVNTKIKEEPTADNRSQSKAAESVSDETILSIGQSDTELPPPTPPSPPMAASVAHEEQDAEETDDDVIEKETGKSPEKDTVSQSVLKEAAISVSNIRKSVEDTCSDDSGICSRPSSRNTPIQKRKKDVFSDGKLLGAVVVLQRLEDIVNSGSVRKRKKLKENKHAEPEVIASDYETESEEKDQCENDSYSLEPQIDAEKEEPETQDSGNAQAQARLQSPECSAQLADLNKERPSLVNSSSIGDREKTAKPDESKEKQTERKSNEKNIVTKELKIVLFKDEISSKGDIDSVRKNPVKSKSDTEIKNTQSSKSQENIRKLKEFRIVLNKEDLAESNHNSKKENPDKDQPSKKPTTPAEDSVDSVPCESAGTRKGSLKRKSERVTRSSDILGSASDTDEYGSDTEPVTTEEKLPPEPQNTNDQAAEITQASKEPIAEIVSSSPSKEGEKEITKVPKSGEEAKVKKEPLSPLKDPKELPYVCVNLVCGPMKDRRLHLQVGYQPIIKAERMTDEALAKWQNPEPKSEGPDPAESTVTTEVPKENSVPDDADKNSAQKDSEQSPVRKKYRGVRKESNKDNFNVSKVIKVVTSEAPGETSVLDKSDENSTQKNSELSTVQKKFRCVRKESNKDKFNVSKDIKVVTSEAPGETSVLDNSDENSTQKNSEQSPVQKKFKGVKKESSKDKLNLSEDINVVSIRKNSASTKTPVEKSVQKETKSATDKKDSEENKYNLKEVKIVLGEKDSLQKDVQKKEKDVMKTNTKDKLKKLKDLTAVISQKDSVQKESAAQKDNIKEYLDDKFRLLKDVKIVLDRESVDRLPKKKILDTTCKSVIKKEKSTQPSTLKDSETNDNIFDTISRMRNKSKRHSDEIRSRSRSPSASRSRRSRSPSDSRSREKLEKSRSVSDLHEESGKRARSLSEEDRTGRKRAKLNSPEEKPDKRKRKRELSEKEEDSQSSKKVKREPSEEKKGKSGPKSKKGAPKRKYGKCPYYSSSHLMEFAVVLLNAVSLNPPPPLVLKFQ